MKVRLGQKGQNLLELVLGVGLVAVVAGAVAVVTINSLQNTQFSKNQLQATKLAQESIEKVRTIKDSNFGVCTQQEVASGATVCSYWDDIWATQFGSVSTTPSCIDNQICTFVLRGTCSVRVSGGGSETKPFCLKYSTAKSDLVGGFKGQILIEDEADSQKRVTSRVYWTDSSGEHMSELITILSRL